jgi:hypothetical protein
MRKATNLCTHRNQESANFRQRVGDSGMCLGRGCEGGDFHVQVVVEVRKFGVVGRSQLLLLRMIKGSALITGQKSSRAEQ